MLIQDESSGNSILAVRLSNGVSTRLAHMGQTLCGAGLKHPDDGEFEF